VEESPDYFKDEDENIPEDKKELANEVDDL
jgi:hypothetical protein